VAAVTERSRAEELDADDPLAGFRDRFAHEDGGPIYLDGNSLGRLPLAARERLEAAIEEWGRRLVTAWQDWIDLPERVGDLLAVHVLGARPREVLVADSTTVNLYKLASAALDLREGAIVAAGDEFPTDRYVLEGLAAARGRELRFGDPRAPGGDVALVCLSLVSYRSGELVDMAAVEEAAGDATVLWDLSHAAGVVPIDLTQADLAVGCTYKYLNAGPGAPAFLYVRRALQERLRTPIQGWFGQREQFLMGPRYDPEPGIARFHAGTPSVLGLAAVGAAVELIADAGIDRIRAKSEALTALAVELHDAWLAPLGFELGSPRDPGRRGSHVSLRHPEAWRICRALVERAGVIPDFRLPDSVRLGFAPLYTRFTDVWDALDRLRTLVESGAYADVDPTLLRVT
jgi:kynureninase